MYKDNINWIVWVYKITASKNIIRVNQHTRSLKNETDPNKKTLVNTATNDYCIFAYVFSGK